MSFLYLSSRDGEVTFKPKQKKVAKKKAMKGEYKFNPICKRTVKVQRYMK